MNPDTINQPPSRESVQARAASVEISSTVLSPHELAILESGKKLYEEAIDSGREFGKSMIEISMGAIPIYFAVVKYFLVDVANVAVTLKILLAIPPLLFLLSSVLFIISFLPKLKVISLDDLKEVRSARNEIVRSRRRLNLIGTIVLLCSIFLSTVVLFVAL